MEPVPPLPPVVSPLYVSTLVHFENLILLPGYCRNKFVCVIIVNFHRIGTVIYDFGHFQHWDKGATLMQQTSHSLQLATSSFDFSNVRQA